MPRANRHYIRGQVWHIAHRCHKKEFILKFSKDRRRWHHWAFEIGCLLLSAVASLAADSPVLTERSYGPVTFGSSLKKIEKRVGEKAKGETGDKGCDFVTFKKFPGIKFMMEDGIVTRADAVSPDIKNKLEIKPGTSLEEVKRRFPAVEVRPHKYNPTGHYLIFKSKDGKRAVLFEEGGGKVTDSRAGIEPSVEYVEDCL